MCVHSHLTQLWLWRRDVSYFEWGPYISGVLQKHDSPLRKLVSRTDLGLSCQQLEIGEDCEPSQLMPCNGMKANEA